MFGAQVRSPRVVILAVGVVIFMALFVGLAFNHSDYWDPASRSHSHPQRPRPEVTEPLGDAELRASFLEQIFKPSVKVDEPKYRLFDAFEWELPENPGWKRPLGENFCIIDMDNRGFAEPGQIFSPTPMSWSDSADIHGLSLGVLNHWLYAKIHGYKYYYIEIEEYEDRRTSWKKPPVMSQILKHHDACVYLDSDAIFHRLDVPFEWLMNYWQVHPGNNSLALALDPVSDNNKDKFGKVYLNTGFIIAQNNEKTYEIMNAWQNCPDDDSKHPECKEFRTNGPGRPTDQGGFGTFIRYDYPEDIRELPCDEANGYVESHSGCSGIFIKHLWTGKSNWVKVAVGDQLPGRFLEIFHRQFLDEFDDYFFTEEELFNGKAHFRSAAAQQLEADTR